MPRKLVLPLILIAIGVLIELFHPFNAMAATLGPGWGDLLNGSAGLACLVVALVIVLITSKREG
ncbi:MULTISPECIES: hypothetical protein [Paraburkholderia]|uniref:hypothetical protein n=1 Tax=Paraburkholderia TaxID=1822464 RepID=UPI002252A8FD|nr:MULTISPECIES: hypothetical protein [Paraburkholderia]MCX4162363.1 hypothetical protein [Paraburkholderia megapolitana]MDN7157858.1 hypothetical protein [Paraburkholderia sp. CHISQ3]MDQ6494905.1 hypothetical protein [Paraburkholderia megapolitana]